MTGALVEAGRTKVHGEISKLALYYGDESRELTYGEGLEWTVPANWEDYWLSIQGEAGATLQVVEIID